MNAHLKFLLAETFRDPQGAMRRLLAWDIGRAAVWPALLVITCVSVLMIKFLGALQPAELSAETPGSNLPPLILAVVFWISIVGLAGCIHFVGRAFGGTGAFRDSLLAMSWLQAVTIVLQVGQVILLLISPILAVLSGFVFMGFGLWLMVNFITVLHGFASRMAVFIGMIVSAFGLSVGLGMVIRLLGVNIANV